MHSAFIVSGYNGYFGPTRCYFRASHVYSESFAFPSYMLLLQRANVFISCRNMFTYVRPKLTRDSKNAIREQYIWIYVRFNYISHRRSIRFDVGLSYINTTLIILLGPLPNFQYFSPFYLETRVAWFIFFLFSRHALPLYPRYFYINILNFRFQISCF